MLFNYIEGIVHEICNLEILPGIITSWTRNQPEKWLFHQELPTQRSTVDNQLIEADSDRQDQNA
jgi:hypothetical protein